MGGEVAIEQIKELCPDTPVVISSGYAEAVTAQRLEGKAAAGFIQKPYTPRELMEKIKNILAASGRS